MFGKFLKRWYTREIYKFIYNKDIGNIHASFLRRNIASRKYICFRYGHLEEFFNKLKHVVILLNKDKTKILGAFNSIKEANNSGLVEKIDIRNAQKCTKLEELANNGVYYLTGNSAIKALKNLGYLDEVIKLNQENQP